VADDGRDSAALLTNTHEFLKAIRDTADFANSLATRPSETPQDKAKSRELAARLQELLIP
jgi:hypothetical protein